MPAEGGESSEIEIVSDSQIVPVPPQFTDSPTQDRFPCWFADGDLIAFLRTRMVSEDVAVHNLFLVPSAGGEPRAITEDADSVEYAAFAFSPDGNRLAYFSNGAVRIRPSEGGVARVVVRPEVLLGCRILNKMTQLGMPYSYRVA